MITAPYNFVPLNEKVFYPDWAEKVSHDIPFEDGESGVIDITITAKSPIFIRNNEVDESDNRLYYTDANGKKISTEFCHFNKRKYIPASSLKGVVRTIAEIISFSKLKLQDKTLSYRDLNNPSYKTKAMDGNKIYMGWLRKDNNNWIIENLGKVTNGETRIKYSEMKDYLSDDIVNEIKSENKAYKKYSKVSFEQLKTDKVTIVFTGSTGNKTKEFLFPNIDPIETHTFNSDDILIKTFKEAYYIGTTDESDDWKNLWQQRFDRGKKIPIFFQKDEDTIKHFGLSMLYKLPYEHSLQDILEKYQNFSDSKDLAETIFGFIDDEESLKGRVQFSHLQCTNEVQFNEKIALPLSTPRPTFYPNYLVQSCKNGKTDEFKTYDSLDASLRGFKMYPPKKEIIKVAKNDKGEDFCQKNSKICSVFQPLDKGTTFRGKIRFHNLKRAELGLLLASLNFINQNEEEKYFHKIGMARAYGFGTVSIKITSLKTRENQTVDTYIDEFKNLLNKELDIDLLKQPRVESLLKLSSYTFKDSELRIMDLKEFVKAKKPNNKFCLIDVTDDEFEKTPNSISRNKMKQAIKQYWDKNFNIFYHPNQIKEFFSENGFETTPEEQRNVYIHNKEDKKFVKLLQLIYLFNEKKLDTEKSKVLYEYLTREDR